MARSTQPLLSVLALLAPPVWAADAALDETAIAYAACLAPEKLEMSSEAFLELRNAESFEDEMLYGVMVRAAMENIEAERRAVLAIGFDSWHSALLARRGDDANANTACTDQHVVPILRVVGTR